MKRREKRRAELLNEIARQSKFISDCEANGISYADGERGQRIRKADQDRLKALENELKALEG